MSDFREIIADRFERAADRMRNSGFLEEERTYRDAADSVRRDLSLDESQALERQLLVNWQPGYSSRLSALAAQGEYDAPGPEALQESFDEPVLTDIESGADQLLSTAAASGLSDPYSSTQAGWVTSSQDVNPYTGLPSTGENSFTGGQSIDPFTVGTPESSNPNSYTGGQNVDPYTGIQNADSFTVSSTSALAFPYLLASDEYPDATNASTASDMGGANYIGPLDGGMSSEPAAFSSSDQNQSIDTSSSVQPTSSPSLPPEESFEGGASTGPFTPAPPAENQSIDTSSSVEPVSSTATPPEESFEGGASTGPFTPAPPAGNQSIDTSSPALPSSSPASLPEESFEGGASTGPFTPAPPTQIQSIDTSSPPTSTGVDLEDSNDDVATDSYNSARNANFAVNTGVPVLVDTGFDDVDQFLNQQAYDRAFNDAVFGEGSYDADQQRLQDTIAAIDNAIPSDAFIIAGVEGKVPLVGPLEFAPEGFAVAGLDRSTFDTYVGGALAGGLGAGPLTVSAGYEWTTSESSPIGIVNIGGEIGAGGWVTTQEYGVFGYIGEPFFIGLGFGWHR